MGGSYRGILSPRFEVQTELARSMRKNERLVFHGTARAIRLINSSLYGKNENILNIHRQSADNSPTKIFFIKLVQNHFAKVFR